MRVSPPKWVWPASIAVGLSVLLVTCSLQSAKAPPKPVTTLSVYGSRIEHLNEQVIWSSDHPLALQIGMPVSESTTEDEITEQADRLFHEYGGEHAEALGFHRVLVSPDNGSQAGAINFLGFQLHLNVDVGTGPAKIDSSAGQIAYDRLADGRWARDGISPPPPTHLEEYTLKTGAKFAWTWGDENNSIGYFAYDCLSCGGNNAAHVVAENFYELLRTAVAPRASEDGLKEVTVAIFLGARRSQWEFPTNIHVKLKRRADGQWIGPIFSPDQLQSFIEKYAAAQRDRGASMRGK